MINYNSCGTITNPNSSALGPTFKKGTPIKKLFLAFFLLMAAPAFAENENNQIGITPYLYRYEPNYVGFTHDNDATDNAFIDFKISVMAPLLPKWFNLNTQYGNVFLAVTIRAGQYLERESSPVIAKTFSPKIFYRHWNDSNKNEDSSYIDIGYAHLSNGQSIHTLDQFKQQAASEQDPTRALDHVSRGWDYVELLVKRATIFNDSKYQGYISLKHFLDYGLLQSKSENYYAWEEADNLKGINRVNGLKFTVKKIHGKNFDLFNVRTRDYKTVLTYETGIGSPFEFHTIRIEESLRLFEIPVMVWYQNGYSNDFAQYYKRTSSYGIAYEIGGF